MNKNQLARIYGQGKKQKILVLLVLYWLILIKWWGPTRPEQNRNIFCPNYTMDVDFVDDHYEEEVCSFFSRRQSFYRAIFANIGTPILIFIKKKKTKVMIGQPKKAAASKRETTSQPSTAVKENCKYFEPKLFTENTLNSKHTTVLLANIETFSSSAKQTNHTDVFLFRTNRGKNLLLLMLFSLVFTSFIWIWISISRKFF